MQKRWQLKPVDESKTQSLQSELGIHKILCALLISRGITSFEEAKAFFRPSLNDLHDPWLMKDMDKAVGRIRKAMTIQEPVLVFGDYDVDGTTSVACMYSFLKKIHAPVDFYIPHRYREGYGVSKAGIDYAHSTGCTLIISLDCGIKSVDLIRYAQTLGIDFIICDHHMPDEQLPPAVAILNPKQTDCPYPYKELCGCGVGFKLMQALTHELSLSEEDVFSYLDLLATAIAADIVPVTGENRILAFHGLLRANSHPNKGIRALMHLSGLSGTLHIHNLVFMIAPRVNAAGRMDDAKKAVQLFIADTDEEALHFAEQLHHDNSDRKEADTSITQEALKEILEQPGWANRKSTLVFKEHWHKGVVGIVASRLIEHYYRPTIVLTRSGDYVAGSARSIPGYNLYEAIHACREHLLGYGGHFAAAGMTLLPEQVNSFREKFEEVVSATIDPALLIPEIIIDAEISITDIQLTFYNILTQMEPFGPGNPSPVFLLRKVVNSGYSRIVKENHIRFSLQSPDHPAIITGIGFSMADKFPLLDNRQPIDVLCKIDLNEWKGEKSLQIRVIDLRPARSS